MSGISDGLALPDQLMAAYGPAMEVYGRYAQVLRPDGSTPALEHYLTLARKAVRDATALRLDELPLDTFDAAPGSLCSGYACTVALTFPRERRCSALRSTG